MTCQFCGEDGHDDNSYMLRPELWERVIEKPYYIPLQLGQVHEMFWT